MKGQKLLLFVTALSSFIHRRFIWLLLGSYSVAALWPGWGLWMQNFSLGNLSFMEEEIPFKLPLLMLAWLLLDAGLEAKLSELKYLPQNLAILAAGFMVKLLIPAAFVIGLSLLMMQWWHNPDEVQSILVGLALVVAMPIAGSSTTWSLNANGNVVTSLGLVLITTFLSPVTAPLLLHAVGLVTTGDYAKELNAMASHGIGLLLILSIVIPSMVGILIRFFYGENWIIQAKPYLKFTRSVVLLLLVYSNAAISLPQAIAHPDYDFLAVIIVITFGLCAFAFAAGWWIAQLFRATVAQRISLMFGLGMSNNGTGLVLASITLANHPQVMLPLISYNLIQQLIAGGVGRMSLQKASTALLK
ncbi:sodium Bile acid symporter family protein [Candidatus Nitrosoglobus terrae]|uniref:Sodium Bile acid symporter family protein n=1 Tax=Candidatus Nitrosoglobus terrae TaxID=1630141 RepID=A0A1Q2SMB3_9GAMM|nr:bile acid:sodium symporter [Candidatus Nitrosoglobus terrae]BAW80274.1 sodium Bile acid symporter family protein [Candidatus Nitrosoglobus terrae]